MLKPIDRMVGRSADSRGAVVVPVNRQPRVALNGVHVFTVRRWGMFKKGPEKQDDAHTVERQPQTMVSCIGSGMSVVGKVECRGPAQIFGKVEGDVRASELVIGEGAEVDGSIEAEDVTISGRVKGTIRAVRVKLQGATVEGEIVHRTLSMDESSVFEGNSRRVENPLERRSDSAEPSNGVGKSLANGSMPGPALVPPDLPAGNGALQHH